MSKQLWEETLIAMTTAGSSFGNYDTAASVLPAPAKLTLPAGFFEIGRTLEIEAWGSISNIVTTPGLITFQAMLDSVIAFTTGQIQLNATAHTTLPFYLKMSLVCRSVGSGTDAKFMGMAFVIGKMFTVTAGQTDGANTNTVMMAPATAPALGTGWDSSASQTLDLFVGWTIADVGNVIKLEQYFVRSRN